MPLVPYATYLPTRFGVIAVQNQVYPSGFKTLWWIAWIEFRVGNLQPKQAAPGARDAYGVEAAAFTLLFAQVVKYRPPPPQKRPQNVGISGRCVVTTGCEEVARASFHLVLDTYWTISLRGGQPPSKGSKWQT